MSRNTPTQTSQLEWTLQLMRHSQYTVNPLNPPYQGDFEDLALVEIIGKFILISRVYYSCLSRRVSVSWREHHS